MGYEWIRAHGQDQHAIARQFVEVRDVLLVCR